MLHDLFRHAESGSVNQVVIPQDQLLHSSVGEIAEIPQIVAEPFHLVQDFLAPRQDGINPAISPSEPGDENAGQAQDEEVGEGAEPERQGEGADHGGESQERDGPGQVPGGPIAQVATPFGAVRLQQGVQLSDRLGRQGTAAKKELQVIPGEGGTNLLTHFQEDGSQQLLLVAQRIRLARHALPLLVRHHHIGDLGGTGFLVEGG